MFIDYGQFFYSVFSENFLRFRKRSSLGRGHKVVLCHYVSYGLGEIRLKSQIPVGENSHKLSVAGNGHAAYLIFCHKVASRAYGLLGGKMERVGNNAVFAALNLVHLSRLLFYGHIFMNYSDAAFARHGNCKLAFRYRIHSRADKGDVQINTLAKRRPQVYGRGQHIRRRRNKQHVVKSQSFLYDFIHIYLLINVFL